MINPEFLLKQIKNDQEALVIISALGNSIDCWLFLKNIGGPKKALESDLFINMIKKRMKEHPNLHKYWLNLREKLDYFYSQQGFLITPLDNYVSRLFKIQNAPLVFFGRFNQSCINTSVQVAVVGARAACKRGLSWSKSLGQSLASRNINVISGGAQGVDQQAHRGALEQGGITCVVSGVLCNFGDKAHKIANIQDQTRMAIIYPFGPFFPQAKYMFVERNKYVVALSDYIIIVQGCEGSGTLHTVRFAEAQKIPIFAVPGALDNPLSFVPNQLLQSGRAKAAVDFDQIAQALMTNEPKTPRKHKKAPELRAIIETSKPLPEVLMLIKNHGNSLSMAEILALSGKSFLAMQKEMLEYELAGRIIKQGSQFVLTGR